MHYQKAQHIILDVSFDSYHDELENVDFWQRLGKEALEKGKFTVLKEAFHCFKPQGMSGFWLLSESHMAFHTWPEMNRIFIDLFSCGNEDDTEKTIDHLVSKVQEMGGKIRKKEGIKRGFVLSPEK